jgi:catechol 2,3-dioxygenase-like lactoylglutathione lyase family enzyme
MSRVNRNLVVQITVVEEDEHHNVVAKLAGHANHCALPEDEADAEAFRRKSCHWAYEGFRVATNGRFDMLEGPSDATALKLLVLRTSQLDAARAFYEAVGITFTEEQHGEGPVHYAGRCGAALVELYPLRPASTPDHTTRLGLDVEDLQQVMIALGRLGTPILSPPEESARSIVVRAFVRDPDGRVVELYQRTATGWELRGGSEEYP